MANEVFANGMEIACKAGAGKVIAAFPDVCMTPPENPATPPGIPVPYPNTAMASDTSGGSKSVKITDDEVMLKNKSYFKKSTGDEAGCAAKKGVISSKNTGKVYFIKWSMDVKVEGKNVDRHFDLTTNNHGSPIANEAVPWPYVDSVALANDHPCKKEKTAEETACESVTEPCPGSLGMPIKATRDKIGKRVSAAQKKKKSRTRRLAIASTNVAEKHKDAECLRARRCKLRPFDAEKDGDRGCCPGQTPHHIPPWSTVKSVGGGHKHGKMLCICLEGAGHSVGSHGKHHHGINYLLEQKSGQTPTGVVKKKVGRDTVFDASLEDHIKASAEVSEAQTNCSKECIESQLNTQFDDNQLNKKTSHNATRTGGTSYGKLEQSDKSALDSFSPASPISTN
ncbi:PAAR-like domain-containing protein [Neptunomonas sp.]|uniref:PAAR-like domain-containing protein n=1 Tax=Neptunomonas sp. TaxID=1971898 RepID=UPI0025EA24AF|nr:PAAR-like domain-containing protein [Neptunomonas sp.]